MAPAVLAAGLDDPFDTEKRLSLRQATSLAARIGDTPCARELSAQPLTVVDAVDLALCRHPQTAEVWAAARVQAATLGQARAAWLPALTGSLGATRFEYASNPYTRQNAALTISWLLYDFGQRAASQANTEALLDVALASRDATLQALFLNAMQAYYAAQAAQAAVGANRAAEKAAREALAAAEARYQVGVVTPADRLQAQTAASQASLNLVKAEGDARNALGSLAHALGFPAGQPLPLADMPPLPAMAGFAGKLETLIAEAQRQRPDLKAAEAQLQAAQASADLARAQGRPTLSLAGGPLWQDSAGSVLRGNSVGVTLNVPLFTGFESTYRIRAAEAQADVRSAQLERLRNQVALDVWKAYQSLTTAGQSLQMTADLLVSAEQSAAVALGRYKAGVGTVLDLLSAQSALAAARLQRIQAELDWHVYRATLAQAMGSLDYSLLQAAQGRP